MHDQTNIERELSEFRQNQLRDSLAEDEKLLAELATYTGGAVIYEPTELGERFTALRRAAAKREHDIHSADTSSMLNLAHFYNPVAGGRTWPYMDAVGRDESMAFGQELHALNVHNPQRVIYELEHEIQALGRRHAESAKVLRRLNLLSDTELALL